MPPSTTRTRRMETGGGVPRPFGGLRGDRRPDMVGPVLRTSSSVGPRSWWNTGTVPASEKTRPVLWNGSASGLSLARRRLLPKVRIGFRKLGDRRRLFLGGGTWSLGHRSQVCRQGTGLLRRRSLPRILVERDRLRCISQCAALAEQFGNGWHGGRACPRGLRPPGVTNAGGRLCWTTRKNSIRGRPMCGGRRLRRNYVSGWSDRFVPRWRHRPSPSVLRSQLLNQQRSDFIICD